jgi:hypothetical protein
MSYITEWLSEQAQAQTAQFIVEDTLANLRTRSGMLDPYIPFKTYTTRKFLGYVVDQINTVASIIAYGQEAPTTSLGGIRKVTGELFKSGLQFVYDEEKMWDMKEAMEKAWYDGVAVQSVPGIPGSNPDLANYIFGTIEQIAKSQVELLDAMTWQALQTGKIMRTDPRTKIVTDIDFTNPYDTTYNHFPTALSGAARWDQYTTANGIQDLYNDVDAFVDTNGYAPVMIVMSRKLLNHLMQQQTTKDAVASTFTIGQVGTVSFEQVIEIMRRRGIPPIVTFDEMYKNEVNGSLVNTRFLNTNRYVFMAPGMGTRCMGPTLENDAMAGVYVVTKEIKQHPPVDATIGVATIVPMFANPKLMFSRQVMDAE